MKSLTACALVALQFAAPSIAFAEEAVSTDVEAAKDGDAIIVTGTRDTRRTQFDTLAPIDVLSSQAIDGSVSDDLSDSLAQLLPSFNVQRLPAADGLATQVVGPGERPFAAYSATSAEALQLRAGYALRWGVMQALRDGPARWLDLGGTDGDEGLRHFKEGNAGKRGRILPLPGEFDFGGSRSSLATTALLGVARNMSRGSRHRPGGKA